MNAQQKKVLQILVIITLIVAVLGVIYLKLIKPKMDKRKEDLRVKETSVIISAQPTVERLDLNLAPMQNQVLDNLDNAGRFQGLGGKIFDMPKAA
jgi:Tfp pilus assembly protein PilO